MKGSNGSSAAGRQRVEDFATVDSGGPPGMMLHQDGTRQEWLEWPFAADLFRLDPLLLDPLLLDDLALTVSADVVVFAFLDVLKLLRRPKSATNV